ncbi:MAG: Gfo/Idh/MocA family oxidoreductase [Candidatus Hydrogenedentes bacterium]|nr:Gfo/Idh/MocA family oxidoreductase [Candidatus Hydrogenedentota bacterium]
MSLNRRAFLAAAALPAAAILSQSALGAADKKRYRACVIGDSKQGEYGHNMHLCFAMRDDVDVVGLADPDEAGRRSHADQAKAQHAYADYREMLDKEKPDLVAIGPRWTLHHREYLLAAAEHGAHGIIEKPVADDLSDADAMVQAAEAKGLKWAVAYNFRATALVQHAKKLIVDDGIIGEVLELRGRGKEDDRAGGEDLLVLGTHIFDLMRFFAGNPEWCEADITVNGKPATKADVHDPTEPLGKIVGDRIQATFGFANGVKGYYGTTKNKDKNGGRWGLDILGSKGVVTVRMDATPGMPAVFVLRDPSWAPGGKNIPWEPLPNAPDIKFKDANKERNAPIVNDLIAAIQENRNPALSLQDGRDSLEMTQAVYEAYVRGARAPLPLKDRSHPLKRWG